MSSHRLNIETCIWATPAAIQLDLSKCIICIKLENKFNFILECK